MNRPKKNLANKAKELWDQRKLDQLAALVASPAAAKVPEVWYYGGLASNALNQKRRAIECWRTACQLNTSYAAPVRALAHEIMESDPIGASELLASLVATNEAEADDLAALGEIRIKQDRLGEAQRLLQKALELDNNNSLALMAMATVYAHVRDRSLTLQYLQKVIDTRDLDISDLESDPEFEFLWHDREFEDLVAQSALVRK